MSENIVNMLIYVIASIVIGVLVHLQYYGIASGAAMLVIVDLMTGLQREEDLR